MSYEFDEFENIQVLIKNPEHNFFRVTRIKDKGTFILKTIREQFPKPKDIAKINHEFVILKKLENNKGVVKAVGLKELQNNLGLLLEDTPFHTIADYTKEKQFSIDEFLDFAIKITDILAKLHQQEIIHRNITPENILYNPKSKEVKLVDFELASELVHEYKPSKVINSLEGTLAYISPEQTGRMNRPITASTDLYSLGVVFYEILTGLLPFEEDDPVSLVYAHIAKVPKSPNEVNSAIPEMISEIIMKLLSKKAEDRYKTAYGLQADLIQCQKGETNLFRLGQRDFTNKFEIPDKLYGRNDEIKYVLSTFEDMCRENSSRLLLVYGYSGIGKTSLIHEVHKPIVQKRGLFLDGKIDQYHRDQPYFSLSQAFNKLIEMWLGETEEILNSWREKLKAELGDVIQVIIDLAPLLGKLFPNPPKLAELNPVETKNRLQLTLLKFLKIITADSTPLVIFIDDAQWSSSTLLELLQYLITSEDLQHLMIVIGYRDNEVLAGHPLLQFIEDVEKQKPISKINLEPLEIDCVNEMIRDTLGYTEEQAKELTDIVYQKTEGNPFFLKEILQDLYTKNLLKFSLSKNVWEYDPKTIREQVNISTNVVDFMVKRLQGFPPDIQRIMNMAACMGNTFDLDILSAVLKQRKNEIAKSFWQIIKEGMVIPVSGDYEHAHEQDIESDQKILYRFQHDRIQQASYQLAADDEIKKNHYQIGKTLLSKYADQEEQYSLEIASQLNKALDLVIDKNELSKLMYINYHAGENMLASSAYSAAIEYFSISKSLLPKDHWTSLYDFTCQLYTSFSKALFSAAEFEKAEELMESLINHSKTFLERMRIIYLKATLYSTVGKRNISIPLAIKGLNEMGVSIKEHPSMLAIVMVQFQTKWFLGRREIPSLINDPEVTDPIKNLIMEFLFLVTQDAMFIGNPPLLVYACLKSVSFSLRYGNFRPTTITYSMYSGFILGGTEAGRQFGELAIALVEKLNATEHKAKTYMLYSLFVLTFHGWWGNKRKYFREAIKYGLETGDIRYLAYAIDHMTPFDPSYTISEVIAFDKEYENTLKMTGYTEIITLRTVYNHFYLALLGKTKDKFSFSDKQYDEFQAVEKMDKLFFNLGVAVYYLLKSINYYIYDEYDLAFQEMKKVQDPVMAAYYGCPESIMHIAFKFLVNAAVFDKLTPDEQKQALKIMNTEMGKMKALADHCPDNFIFHYYAMQAEMAIIEGKPWGEIIDFYDQAAEAAEKYKFLTFVGLYNERAAKFALQHGKKELAAAYLLKARNGYERWGAAEKVKHLNEKYGELIAPQLTTSGGISLDYNTILKLSRSLFEERSVQKLIEKTLRILAENIGAQYCTLMLLKDKKLVIEGVFDTITNKLNVLSSLALTEEYVPVKLINYVFRSGKDVVINDITKNTEYSQYPYVLTHPVKSVICAPIVYHQDLVGIFYGEHREISGAFTNERLEMLRVLSGQIAICIENSRYLEHTERLYRATERFVPKPFLKLLKKEHIEDVYLGDSTEIILTVLFSDIRGYTTISETQNPKDAFAFINHYLEVMAPIIRAHGGFINQYQGDGIMALFPGSAEDGINAVQGLSKALISFNEEHAKFNRPVLRVGYGLNTGLAMLGTIGEKERMDANVISDAINLASRIEGLNKFYGTVALVGEATINALRDKSKYVTRIVDKVKVKGKKNAIYLYELYLSDEISKEEKEFIKNYESAFKTYESGDFTKAYSQFLLCKKHRPNDQSTNILLERCLILQKNKPSEDWDGAYEMTHK